ncbi:hypothetical protein SM124_06600 [Bacillus sp. 31A1R]|uniref:Uncharacterized protein n=1 Tax=Robertmurraya mangrovi TaxID=3098077 RepID=A0ABU5IW84_9BACI|nr:hypothetical protein [Bacillus sp. 31A1R]MDZ5471414.1 hypothetical protein [Bacillus sp. 31A1R]
MNKSLISRICLALALLITVYNFFITDTPTNSATGVVLLLLMIPNILTVLKN